MGEIIYLSERIKRINNTKEELEAQRKKALNKKTTFQVGSAETAVPGRQEQTEQSPRDLKGCI